MTPRAWLAASSGLLLSTPACTEDSYVIGAVCGAVGTCPAGGAAAGTAGADASGDGGDATGGAGHAGAPSDATLELDLTGSGVERLPRRLLGEEPSHFLIAGDATLAGWEARVGDGFDVVAPEALAVAQPAPFADAGGVLRHAGAVTFSANSSWAETGAPAVALEAVFRGEPGAVLLSQRDAQAGMDLLLDQDGRLSLRLDSGADELLVTSRALVPDAWHHCLALLDVEQATAQLFCNGHAGAAAGVPAGFTVPAVAAPATLGSNAAAGLHWAQLARWQAATWGPRGAWTDLARERFARLVGTYAAGAAEPLPFAEVRASGAYLDMTPSDAPELRRLHPVGEHWPRIVCRPTGDGPRTCGLLIEASSSQPLAPAALALDNWSATALSVEPGSAPGPTGARTLFSLTPGAQATEHALSLAVPTGDGPAVLSFFARAAGARLLRAEVAGLAGATFDLIEPGVVEATDTHVSSAEDWGDGLVRLSFSFDVDAGQELLRIAVLDDGGAPVFAGDGGVAAHAGDVELRFRSYSTPLPTFGAIQAADHLVYPTGNGNLPSGAWFDFSAELWLPAAPLLADAAVLNANFATRYDQQINLFLSPPDGAPHFWGLRGDATHWQLSGSQALADGNLHRVAAGVGPDGATLGVDGRSVTEPAGRYPLNALDRIEIGTSTSSSGPLTGILRRIRVAPSPAE